MFLPVYPNEFCDRLRLVNQKSNVVMMQTASMMQVLPQVTNYLKKCKIPNQQTKKIKHF